MIPPQSCSTLEGWGMGGCLSCSVKSSMAQRIKILVERDRGWGRDPGGDLRYLLKRMEDLQLLGEKMVFYIRMLPEFSGQRLLNNKNNQQLTHTANPVRLQYGLRYDKGTHFVNVAEMGVIKDGTASGVIPDTSFFAVNYPGYPSSISRAIDTLGGADGIAKNPLIKHNFSSKQAIDHQENIMADQAALNFE
eukprot:Gb_12849 [translate_table: standard]